jgi:hypothetical protein
LARALGTGGYLSGVELYESQAILRVFPQESNILYATGDDSVLKTFDSFVKAETSYVASHPVMARALEILAEEHPDLAADITVSDLTGSIEIRRSDSLIVLTTREPRSRLRNRQAGGGRGRLHGADRRDGGGPLRRPAGRACTPASGTRRTARHARATSWRSAANTASAPSRAPMSRRSRRSTRSTRGCPRSGSTLATLEASNGATSVDTSDTEIMRATLLDRTMADLGFERARLMSELAGLRAGYEGQTNPRFEQAERAKLEEIAVIEEALADRREQIRILGQTGALTDAAADGTTTTSRKSAASTTGWRVSSRPPGWRRATSTAAGSSWTASSARSRNRRTCWRKHAARWR